MRNVQTRTIVFNCGCTDREIPTRTGVISAKKYKGTNLTVMYKVHEKGKLSAFSQIQNPSSYLT